MMFFLDVFCNKWMFSNNGVTPPKNDGLYGFCDVFWVPTVFPLFRIFQGKFRGGGGKRSN